MRATTPYHITRLDNGLRVICTRAAGSVSYIGIAVNAGSRDEDESRQGLAHLVEHNIFKGTPQRKAWQIARCMETVGGELNAYTSKEETMVYTNAPSGYEERAVQLLHDLVADSHFPSDELEKEREVVIEEIHSYLDSPADAVYDEFEEHAYAGSSLAHNILGTPQSVRGLTQSDCRQFLEYRYTPAEMVVYCHTPLDPERMTAIAGRHFGQMHRPGVCPVRTAPPAMQPFDLRRDEGNHQANTVMGVRVFGRTDPGRFALFLLNNYLGGPGMNSRLNREMRDRRGYVYTVESNVSLMSDTGLMTVYFGSDPSTVSRCRRIVLNEIDRLAQGPMAARAFDAVKRQYCGQLTVSSDHIESRAMSRAKSLLFFDEIHDIATTAAHIMELTPDDMCEAARLLRPECFGTLTLS